MDSSSYIRQNKISSNADAESSAKEARTKISDDRNFIEIIIAFLEKIFSSGIFSDCLSTRIKIIVKSIITVVCVIGFMALASALENGALDFPKSLIFGGALSVIETFCLIN